ncbi:MAG: YwaF family protein [Lachnospiraceae bacterium]|nr:YwaF family protein [Lachnospiraceae bacterium]
MKDFFMFETEFPAGSGFVLFGPCHLMWLFCIAVFTGISAYLYKKQGEEERREINHVMGIVFPVISIYRDMVLMLTGHFDRGFLPFHLCSMALWIATLYAWTEWRFVGVIYVLLCVPGAVGALLFPNWDAYPFFNYMHIHGFISHGLIVAFGIWLVLSDKVVSKWKDFWMPVVFGIAGFILLRPINSILGTNFWFLNRPSHGSPTVWIFEITGEKWYALGYFLFCMVVVAVWQGILVVLDRLFNKRRVVR